MKEFEQRALDSLKRTMGLKNTDLYVTLVCADIRIQRQAFDNDVLKNKLKDFVNTVASAVNEYGMSPRAYQKMRQIIKQGDELINDEIDQKA